MRSVSPELLAAMQSGAIKFAFLYEGEFDDQYLRLTTWDYDLEFNGGIFLGNGYFLGPGPIESSNDGSMDGIEVYLSGVPASMMSLVLGKTSRRLRGKIYTVLLDDNEEIIDAPITSFYGFMDVPMIEKKPQPEGSDITISYETRRADFARAKEYRYTGETQRLFDPTDTGFNRDLSSWSGLWGLAKTVKTRKDPPKRRPEL